MLTQRFRLIMSLLAQSRIYNIRTSSIPFYLIRIRKCHFRSAPAGIGRACLWTASWVCPSLYVFEKRLRNEFFSPFSIGEGLEQVRICSRNVWAIWFGCGGNRSPPGILLSRFLRIL